MALIILEGLDKTGKSTVAEHFRKEERYEYIHMTAPAKWHTRNTYFAEMLHTIAMTAGKKVVIDRSWYGEQVWPQVFGNREPLLLHADLQALTAVAEQLHLGEVKLIYMHDPDEAAHLERIRKFKEPSYNFQKARAMYDDVVLIHKFNELTFQEAEARGWT